MKLRGFLQDILFKAFSFNLFIVKMCSVKDLRRDLIKSALVAIFVFWNFYSLSNNSNKTVLLTNFDSSVTNTHSFLSPLHLVKKRDFNSRDSYKQIEVFLNQHNLTYDKHPERIAITQKEADLLNGYFETEESSQSSFNQIVLSKNKFLYKRSKDLTIVPEIYTLEVSDRFIKGQSLLKDYGISKRYLKKQKKSLSHLFHLGFYLIEKASDSPSNDIYIHTERANPVEDFPAFFKVIKKDSEQRNEKFFLNRTPKIKSVFRLKHPEGFAHGESLLERKSNIGKHVIERLIQNKEQNIDFVFVESNASYINEANKIFKALSLSKEVIENKISIHVLFTGNNQSLNSLEDQQSRFITWKNGVSNPIESELSKKLGLPSSLLNSLSKDLQTADDNLLSDCRQLF